MDGNLLTGTKPGLGAARTARAPAMGVRVHLLVMALLALLPAWGLAGFAAWRFADVERARLLGIGQDTARDIATGVEREVSAIRASLAALATSPALATGDLVAFDRQLGLLYGGGVLSVALEPMPRGAVVTADDPRLQRDRLTGRPVVIFRQRVAGERDDPAQLVLRSDAARFWSAIIDRARLPQGWVASILDPDHTILARWPEPERFIGRPVHPDALAVLQRAPQDTPGGWGSGSTREGDPVRIAWRRVDGMPWTVLVGVPVEAVDGALHRAMVPILVIGLPLLVGLSLATTIWASRRIARPLRALEATALAAGHDALAEAPPGSGVREIDAAGRALAAAAAHLREREAENTALATRLEAVLESTTDCVVVLDRTLIPLYLNGRARALMRGDAGEGWQGLPLARGSAFAEGFERAFRTGAPVSVAARLEGSADRWFAADAFPSPQGLTVFFRDVTAAHAAEQALRASEAALRESELRFRVLAEAVPQIVWSCDPQGRIDYLNPRFFQFTGWPADTRLAEAELPIHPEERRATGHAWRTALATGAPYEAEYRLRRADGAWRWFVARALPVRGADEATRRWIGTATDVTELVETRQALERQVAAEAAAREAAVRAAAALAASEARFRGFAEASPDVLWMLDPGTDRLGYLSPAYAEIWGEAAPAEPRLADLIRGVLPEDAAAAEALLPRLLAGEAAQAELRIRRADGEQRWVRLTGFAIGEGARVGGFVRDISRRQEAAQRQRLLIGELNHRVKNTLATVLALARQTERSARRAGTSAADAEVETSFVSDFQARLMALARGHDLLTASTWRGAMLREVAAAALSPWRDGGDARRICLDGPDVWLAPRQALGLALAIHEMATNAVKHGALRVPEGAVGLTWSCDAEAWVEARWVESGGPVVTPPAASGFGTRLLRQGLGTELGVGAEIRLDYPPEGFRATMRFQPLQDEDAS